MRGSARLYLNVDLCVHHLDNYRLRGVTGCRVRGCGLGRGGGVVSSAAGPVRSEVSLALVETPHLLQGEVWRTDLLHGLLAVCNERSHYHDAACGQ